MIPFIIVTFFSLPSFLHATPETAPEAASSHAFLKRLLPACLITSAAASVTIAMKGQIEKRLIDKDTNTQQMSEENTLQEINHLNTDIGQFNDSNQGATKTASSKTPDDQEHKISCSRPNKSNANKKPIRSWKSKSSTRPKSNESHTIREQSPSIPAPFVNTRMISPTKNQDFGLETASSSVATTPSQPERLNNSSTGISTQPPRFTEQIAHYEEKLKLMQKIEQQRNDCSGLWREDVQAQTCFIDAMAAAGIRFQDLPQRAQQYFQNMQPGDWRNQLGPHALVQGIAPQHFNTIQYPTQNHFWIGNNIEIIPLGNLGVRILGIGDASARDKKQLENYLNTKFPNSALALKSTQDHGHYTAFVPNVGFASAGFEGFDRAEDLHARLEQLKDEGITQQEIDQIRQQMYGVDDAVKSPQAYLNDINPSTPNLAEDLQPNLMLLDLNKLLDRAN